MGLAIEDVPIVFEMYKKRYTERDERHEEIHEVIAGDWESVDPNEDPIPPSAANMIQVAIEDTGDAAAVRPSVRVMPWKPTAPVKESAAKAERIAQHYVRTSKIDFLLSPTVQRMAAYGLCPWVVWPDFEQVVPIIEMRDPRGCYPEPGIRLGERARNVMFTREAYFSQLPEKHRNALLEFSEENRSLRHTWEKNATLTIVEYFDEEEILVTALLKSGYSGAQANPSSFASVPVELSRINHNLSVCPVIVGERFTTDGEHRGQFDQVVGPQKAHNRLMDLLVDYADQAVYSDTWVKDAIGEISFGGGSYITLGPNGGIGRVPPAVSSLNVTQDLAMMEEAVHLGGRWPKSRPGEIDQSIASAKFLEASAGMMNTVIKGYHLVLKSMIESAVQLCFEVDKKVLGPERGPRVASGILRNNEFMIEYTTDEIDLKNMVVVDYGMGLGKDPSQSAVLQIQYAQNGYISEEFVQESIEGVNDVQRERARIDAEKFKQILFGKIIEAVQMGQITNRQLIELTKKRYEGEDLFELFERFVVEPEEEAIALGPGPVSGLTGQPLGLGPGAAPPGAGGGPTPPPAPDPSQLLARLNTPAGPGGTLGTQTLNEGRNAG